MLTRRQMIGAGAALVAAPALIRAQGLSADPYSLGVTSGDPAPDGFVIWTRLAVAPLDPHGGMAMAPAPLRWEVASDPRFADIVQAGDAVARPELGHSVHVEVTGLRPDQPYWYRFSVAAGQSPIGRARTLPLPTASPASLHFGVAGCQNYEDGYYTAFRHLAEEDLAFVYHYGDFIYEGAARAVGPVPRPWGGMAQTVRTHRGDACYSLDDYRQRYSQYLRDPDLALARARHCWISTFDDHEVANNWADDIDPALTPPDIFHLRRQAAMQAWYEFMPVRRARFPRDGVVTGWRGLAYGNLLSMNILDTRSARSDQPCGDGFKPACPGVLDNAARLLSPDEEAWLDASLRRGRASRWTCLAQQVMMMALDRRLSADQPERLLNLDSWAGYEVPRQRLLSHLRGLGNAIVLTGDEHQNYAGVLEDDKGRPVAVEFVSTSISSGGDGSDLRPGNDVVRANNPQLRFTNDQRGYLVCRVEPDEWHSDFMVMDKVSTPGGAISKRATATVTRGEAEVRMG